MGKGKETQFKKHYISIARLYLLTTVFYPVIRTPNLPTDSGLLPAIRSSVLENSTLLSSAQIISTRHYGRHVKTICKWKMPNIQLGIVFRYIYICETTAGWLAGWFLNLNLLGCLGFWMFLGVLDVWLFVSCSMDDWMNQSNHPRKPFRDDFIILRFEIRNSKFENPRKKKERRKTKFLKQTKSFYFVFCLFVNKPCSKCYLILFYKKKKIKRFKHIQPCLDLVHGYSNKRITYTLCKATATETETIQYFTDKRT